MAYDDNHSHLTGCIIMHSTMPLNLNQVAIARDCVITQLRAPADAPDWLPWLSELGFIVGEHVSVKRRSILRKGAVVVRVGQSTFALHSEEAACVWVSPTVSSNEPSENAGVQA